MTTTSLPPSDDALLGVLHDVADAVGGALARVTDWGPSGLRDGQYAADLLADEAALGVLRAAGLGILSEESGLEGDDRDLVAVLDPLDGSTNASHGVPWFATSVCIVDGAGPRVGLVANQAGGGRERYWAVRGGGAWCDGRRIEAGSTRDLDAALVALSGLPPRHLGWAQFRAFGASALDLCLVAAGVIDGFMDWSDDAHGVWDVAAGALVCREAGAHVVDAFERELVVRDPAARRTPIAAGTSQLLGRLLDVRRAG